MNKSVFGAWFDGFGAVSRLKEKLLALQRTDATVRTNVPTNERKTLFCLVC